MSLYEVRLGIMLARELEEFVMKMLEGRGAWEKGGRERGVDL